MHFDPSFCLLSIPLYRPSYVDYLIVFSSWTKALFIHKCKHGNKSPLK